ncbi:MAG: acetylglutamate kinase [Patescibacteria group bacterium]|nr:MAG: acetylglutamate kinase [Patescibacteria group bacterium]
MNELILIKIGGSLIADKNKIYEINKQVVGKLVSSISKFLEKKKNSQLVIANGAGSFGHYTVIKYNLNRLKGAYLTDLQKSGIGFVHSKVSYLNAYLNNELSEQGVSVVSFSPISYLFKDEELSLFAKPLLSALSLGLNISFYGDLIFTKDKQTTVVSTEQLLEIFVDKLLAKTAFKVSKVVFVTNVSGVLDNHGDVIKKITQDFSSDQVNIFKVKKDVSGGMKIKLKTALHFAKQGIKTYICGVNDFENCLFDLPGGYTVVV